MCIWNCLGSIDSPNSKSRMAVGVTRFLDSMWKNYGSNYVYACVAKPLERLFGLWSSGLYGNWNRNSISAYPCF